MDSNFISIARECLIQFKSGSGYAVLVLLGINLEARTGGNCYYILEMIYTGLYIYF